MGVIGMTLNYDDEVVGMQLDHQGDSLLIVSANGMGKRTSTDEYSVQNRGGKGVKCYKVTDKTGDIIGVKAVNDDHEIMMITSTGIIIQIKMSDLRLIGRDTSGVKLIDLEDGVTVAQIAKVREKVSDGVSEFDNVDDALEDIPEQEIIDDDFDEDEDMIFPKEEDEDE
jgi:DNA gyrase subunit A